MENEVPEYRVKRRPDVPWEPASSQEVAEFRARDAAVLEAEKAQEAADRLAYHQHEAALAQQWEDWAVRAEMNRTDLPPSRKKVRITINAGTNTGQAIGEATIEGVINHDQQATVSFNVVEMMVGGVMPADTLEQHANPQLAPYERDHLPELSDLVQDFLTSMEGRHWLWQFSQQMIGLDEIEARFGLRIAEAFQMWVALQKDMEKEVKNVAECLLANDQASSSEAATVAVELPGEDRGSVEGPEVAKIVDTEVAGNVEIVDEEVHGNGGETVEGVSQDNHVAPGSSNAVGAAEATLQDSLEDDDSVLREGLGDAFGDDGNQENVDKEEAAHAEEQMDIEEAAGVVDGEPCAAPSAWARILEAWNDPTMDAGLPDSLLSCGNFQHGDEHSAVEHQDGNTLGGLAAEAASSTMTVSGSTSSTEGDNRAEQVRKQTDLKGWLK